MQHRRGFTLIEAGFSVAALAGLLCLGAATQPEGQGRGEGTFLSSLAKARASARQIKDATQVRGIHQGLIMFAQNNKDSFPLPSLLDTEDHTLDVPAAEKDTTSHIMSVMIFNGFFGPELCVSPAETNKKIKVFEAYAYSSPAAAKDPKMALWDPAFSADFTGEGGGAFSYAHLMPSPTRRGEWANSFNALFPAVGNRGPRVDALRVVEGKVRPVLPEASNTYRIHGGPTTWEGNIAFNDNHTEFMTATAGELTYLDREKVKKADHFFFDENDDPADSNAVLGVYIRSGVSTDFFQGIWD
jgi:hypothetical protein